MRSVAIFLVFFIQCHIALGMTKEERHELLDAIRPLATRLAGQPVRFKVDRLNYESGWAVLVGSLMAQEGKAMDWSKARNCDPTLDKMLWVVAKKEQSGWQVKQIFICASEPPYWNLEPKVAFSRPCTLYTGLEINGYETAEQKCLAYVEKKRRQRR